MARSVGECSSYRRCACIRPSEDKHKTSGADSDHTLFFLPAGGFSVDINRFSCCPFVKNNSELPCYQGHGWNSLCLPVWKTVKTKANGTEAADITGLQNPKKNTNTKSLLSPGKKK